MNQVLQTPSPGNPPSGPGRLVGRWFLSDPTYKQPRLVHVLAAVSPSAVLCAFHKDVNAPGEEMVLRVRDMRLRPLYTSCEALTAAIKWETEE